ncbi:MAG: hypothetical protein J6C59_02015 [Muribaculaceae bacterium]|nr:hypothetical protein [Muribaculaceae bacterium]
MKQSTTLSLFAAAALFGLASCSSDEPAVITGNGAETFTISLPTELTRDFNDGLSAKNLYIAVYPKGEGSATASPLICSFPTALANETLISGATFTGLTANVTIQLVKDQSYDVLFFAESYTDGTDECPYAFTPATRSMKVTYGKMVCNDDAPDAFYYHGEIKASGTNHPIELRRPFAQINIGTDDYDTAVKAGMTVTSSAVTFSNLADTFDFVTGAATGNAENVEFANADIPAASQPFPTGAAGQYRYLNMAYVLVGTGTGDQAVINSVQMSLNEATTPFATYTNIPAKTNFQTNIYGSLLTNKENFTVTINPAFGGAYNNGLLAVATEDDFNAAVAAGKDIVLASNVTLSSPVTVEKPMTIDLGSKTLNIGSQSITNAAGNDLTIQGEGTVMGTVCDMIQNNGNLTVKGGRFAVYTSDYFKTAISNNAGGTCTIEDGTFTSGRAPMYNQGTMVINGGSFTTTSNSSGDSYVLYNDVIDQASKNANITVNGGTFTTNGGYAIMMRSGGLKGGKLTFNDGTVIAKNGYALAGQYCPDININGGTFSGGGALKIDGCTTNITGGNFISINYYALILDIETSMSSVANISGGYFFSTPTYATIYCEKSATANITGGYFTNLFKDNNQNTTWPTAEGYEAVQLTPALTQTIAGTNCTFNYQVKAQ